MPFSVRCMAANCKLASEASAAYLGFGMTFCMALSEPLSCYYLSLMLLLVTDTILCNSWGRREGGSLMCLGNSEGTTEPLHSGEECVSINEVLTRVGDKWSVQ